MQSYTRHQLKEDKFQEGMRDALAQAQAHRQQIVVGAIVIILIVLAVGGFGVWHSSQEDKASTELGTAITTYTAPIRPADAPVDPTIVSFASITERDKEAEKLFQQVADKYPHTDSGKNALYLAAAAALDAGQYSDAEAKFKKVADSSSKDVSAMAKLGLASVYQATNRDQDAINIYNDLMKHPTESVSKERVEFALASLYERKDPAQAKKMYDQLSKDKNPLVAQIATQRLGTTK